MAQIAQNLVADPQDDASEICLGGRWQRMEVGRRVGRGCRVYTVENETGTGT